MISEIRFAYVFDLLRVRIRWSQVMSRFVCDGYRDDVHCVDAIWWDIVMIKSLPGKHFSIDYKYRNPRFGGRSQYNTTQQKHTETPRPNTIQQHNKNIQKRQNPIQYNNTTKTYRNVKTQYITTTQQKHTETPKPIQYNNTIKTYRNGKT